MFLNYTLKCLLIFTTHIIECNDYKNKKLKKSNKNKKFKQNIKLLNTDNNIEFGNKYYDNLEKDGFKNKKLKKILIMH